MEHNRRRLYTDLDEDVFLLVQKYFSYGMRKTIISALLKQSLTAISKYGMKALNDIEEGRLYLQYGPQEFEEEHNTDV